MGLLNLFGGKGGKGGLRKLAQKVTEKYGPPENRQKAIQQLADQGTAEALGVLCLRFTVRANPGITDDEEKENVRRILVDAGETAVGPVKEFLNHQESGVSWGLRVLASLRPPADVVATALGLLHKLGREYTRDPEKKLVLLSWLAEHPATSPPSRSPRAAARTRWSTTRSSRCWRTSRTTSASRRSGWWRGNRSRRRRGWRCSSCSAATGTTRACVARSCRRSPSSVPT